MTSAQNKLIAAYEPNRSVVIVRDEKVYGVVGEFRSNVRRAFKLPEYTAGFEVHLDALAKISHDYKPLSKYPSVTQDISLKVAPDVSYESVERAALEVLAEADFDTVLSPVSIYQSKDDAASKTITLRLVTTSHLKTLKDSDINELLSVVSRRTHEVLGAERI
jgi:phenylalanyl-tRNA synthetase beta chain